MRKTLIGWLLLILTAITANAQEITVGGTVVSKEYGEPLIGATVMSLATGSGTATDIDWNFTITVPEGSKIKVTYVGYQDFTGIATRGSPAFASGGRASATRARAGVPEFCACFCRGVSTAPRF